MALREWMESTSQDVRYALRGLRREPLFTGFAVAALALGIGANAAVYGVVDRLLISGPDHVEHPERLVCSDRSSNVSPAVNNGIFVIAHCNADAINIDVAQSHIDGVSVKKFT